MNMQALPLIGALFSVSIVGALSSASAAESRVISIGWTGASATTARCVSYVGQL
jgi:hypothetical protein